VINKYDANNALRLELDHRNSQIGRTLTLFKTFLDTRKKITFAPLLIKALLK